MKIRKKDIRKLIDFLEEEDSNTLFSLPNDWIELSNTPILTENTESIKFDWNNFQVKVNTQWEYEQVLGYIRTEYNCLLDIIHDNFIDSIGKNEYIGVINGEGTYDEQPFVQTQAIDLIEFFNFVNKKKDEEPF